MTETTNGTKSKLRLLELSIQNLRGFTEASLHLVSPVVFLIGPNNAGKTSFFKLMDLMFNRDLDREFGSVSDELMAELMPARETRNAARRLTLRIQVDDGRRHKKLDCKDGVATLRLSLRKFDRKIRLNLGDPKKGEEHDRNAYAFLKELRDSFRFVYVPASRSADSATFQETTLKAIADSLASAFVRPGKGASATERAAAGALDTISELSEPARQFWTALVERLPSGWIRTNEALPDIDRDALSRFIAEHTILQITTGEHDASGVQPSDVGSGLQSLISLEFHRLLATVEDRLLILAVEEPEVFLHPSSQRFLGRQLASGKLADTTLVSTHSPLIVEECSFEQVALIRNHRISQAFIDDARRKDINSTIMQGRGAEVLFAKSILLVEGSGDREYWEALPRRAARIGDSMVVDNCYVLETGSNSSCGPWLRLLESFSGAHFQWMLLLDADSATHLKQAVKSSRASLSVRQSRGIESVKRAYDATRLADVEKHALDLAEVGHDEAVLLLAPGDLESIMCTGLTRKSTLKICPEIGLKPLSGKALSVRLGTKHRSSGKAASGGLKHPWMRAKIGHLTPPSDISAFAYKVLELWISGASNPQMARQIIDGLRTSPE